MSTTASDATPGADQVRPVGRPAHLICIVCFGIRRLPTTHRRVRSGRSLATRARVADGLDERLVRERYRRLRAVMPYGG